MMLELVSAHKDSQNDRLVDFLLVKLEISYRTRNGGLLEVRTNCRKNIWANRTHDEYEVWIGPLSRW